MNFIYTYKHEVYIMQHFLSLLISAFPTFCLFFGLMGISQCAFLSFLFSVSINPGRSIFKPFIFSDCSTPVLRVVSPQFGPDDPVKKQPRFQNKVDRRHDLYKAHQAALNTMETNPVGTDGQPRSMIVLCRSWESWMFTFTLYMFTAESLLLRVELWMSHSIGMTLPAQSKTQQDLTVSADKTHDEMQTKHKQTAGTHSESKKQGSVMTTLQPVTSARMQVLIL